MLPFNLRVLCYVYVLYSTVRRLCVPYVSLIVRYNNIRNISLVQFLEHASIYAINLTLKKLYSEKILILQLGRTLRLLSDI